LVDKSTWSFETCTYKYWNEGI
jgi:hypothetical protein